MEKAYALYQSSAEFHGGEYPDSDRAIYERGFRDAVGLSQRVALGEMRMDISDLIRALVPESPK